MAKRIGRRSLQPFPSQLSYKVRHYNTIPSAKSVLDYGTRRTDGEWFSKMQNFTTLVFLTIVEVKVATLSFHSIISRYPVFIQTRK